MSVFGKRLALALALAGCGGEGDRLAPVAQFKEEPIGSGGSGGATPGSGGSGGSGGSDGSGGAEAPRRTVFTVNPLGNLEGNLLADGDFELSISGRPGQYGWRLFGFSNGERPIAAETGGLCKSGLRCARLPAKHALYATGAAAPGGASHHASLFGKPPEGQDCSAIEPLAVDCGSLTVLKALKADAPPDAAGFCRYEASLSPSESGICLYVESRFAEGDAIVDAGSLRPVPADGSATQLKKPPKGESVVPSKDLTARLRRVAEAIRRGRRFGAPPPLPRPPSNE